MSDRPPTDDILALQKSLRAFAAARDWEQFHSPKNLAMALAGECGEVLEHFQWLTETQSVTLDAEAKREVGYELADVFIYTLRLADVLGVGVMQAARDQMAINDGRYPAAKARGSAARAKTYESE